MVKLFYHFCVLVGGGGPWRSEPWRCWYWKENPWSYILGIIGFFTLPDIIIYFNTIQDPSFRVQGFAAIIFIIIPLLYFAREAFLVRVDSSG